MVLLLHLMDMVFPMVPLAVSLHHSFGTYKFGSGHLVVAEAGKAERTMRQGTAVG